jgi:DNA-binding transcriptional MerR regulator
VNPVNKLADQQKVDELERAYPEGMSVQQIVDVCAAGGDKLTEATFRKYVQLGLLPRSVRVGKKGKHRGSQGLYPANTVRQIQLIRRLMSQGFTIEEIQTRFLFVRGDIDALDRELERMLSQLERAPEADDVMIRREVEEARRLSRALLEKFRDIERRMNVQARMERAAV